MKKIKMLDFINKIMDMECGTTYSFRIPEPDGIWYGVKCMELPFDGGKGWMFGKYGGDEVLALQNDEFTFDDIERYLFQHVWHDGELVLEYEKERRNMKDGWHKVSGWDVWIEDNRITRGITGNDLKQKPIYPYRWSKTENCWVNVAPVSVAAFKSGIKRGTIQMF